MSATNKLLRTFNVTDAARFQPLIDHRLAAARAQLDSEERDVEIRRLQGSIRELKYLQGFLENVGQVTNNDHEPTAPDHFS